MALEGPALITIDVEQKPSKRERSLNDETSLNEDKKQFVSECNPFLGKNILNYTPPPQVSVEHVLIELDNEAVSSNATPQIATEVQTALGAACRTLSSSNPFQAEGSILGQPTMTSSINITPPQQPKVRTNPLSQEPTRGNNPPPQQPRVSNNTAPGAFQFSTPDGYKGVLRTKTSPSQPEKALDAGITPPALTPPARPQRPERPDSSKNGKSNPNLPQNEDTVPSFRDFVSEMRSRMERTFQDTNQFMTGFTSELERTNLRVEEWRQESLRTTRELREVVAVQGERIEKLETELKALALESAKREAGYVPEPEQQKLLYDINSIRHIPADYSNNALSPPDQEALMRQCMELFPQAVVEGAEQAVGCRRYVISFGVGYGYTGISHPHNPIPPFIEDIRIWLSELLGENFNQCSMTFYELGARMPRHGDREASLVPGSKIAAISLNESKIMAFYRRGMNTEIGRVNLLPGSLLVMRQEDQQDTDHAILAGPATTVEWNGFRVSLVFRRLKEKRPIHIKLLGDSNYADKEGENTKIVFGDHKGQLGSLLPGDARNIPHIGKLPNVGGTFEGYTDVVLGVGINNLKFPQQESNEPKKVVAKIAQFCDAILNENRGINIFLPEVLPTRDPALTPIISSYNKLLRSYVSNRAGRVTLISTEVFQDSQGLLDLRFSTKQDALHLNSTGVSLLAGRIKYEIKAKYGLQVPPHLKKKRRDNRRPR